MRSKSIVAALITSILLSSVPLNANASAKPKCTGKNLTSYNKNLKIFNKSLAEYLKYSDPNSWEYQNFSSSQLSELRRLTYKNTLSYGGYLEKYAKICKVKMPQWWIDEWADFPDE